MNYDDFGAFVLDVLQGAADVTDLVVGGADSVLESGQLASGDLEDAQRSRREAGGADKVLAVLVMDTGESPSPQGDWTASCTVFVYDRDQGYTNIRKVRKAIIEEIVQHPDDPVALPLGAYVKDIEYAGRTGHDQFDQFQLDFEAIRLRGVLWLEEKDKYV